MKTSICLVLALVAVATSVGCSTASEEEKGATSSAIEAQEEGRCAVADGLYCGGNGVSGASNVLYRCTNGWVTVAQRCAACEWMPDGANDRCDVSPGGVPVEGEYALHEPAFSTRPAA